MYSRRRKKKKKKEGKESEPLAEKLHDKKSKRIMQKSKRGDR